MADVLVDPRTGTKYISMPEYNGTIPTGGDSLTQNLNVFYDVSPPSLRGETSYEKTVLIVEFNRREISHGCLPRRRSSCS